MKKKSENTRSAVSSSDLFKWIYRYALCGVCVVGSLLWTVYCIVTLSQLQAMANGTDFLDMTVNNFMEAQALLARIDVFKGLLVWAIIISVVCIGGVVLLVFYQLKWKEKLDRAIESRKEARKNRVKEPTAPVAVPVQAPPQVRFCPHCGKKQEGEKAFCGFCGGKLSK